MSRRVGQGRAIHWAEAFGLSAAFHVGVVFFALDFINDIRFLPDDQPPKVDILVTSLSFDEMTLTEAASETPGNTDEDLETPQAVEQDTLTGTEPDAEDADLATPDVAEQIDDTEALEDVADAEELTPETPETLEAETTEAVEPETLEPEVAEVADAEALTPEPVAPDPETPAAVETETLAAADPVAEEPAALAPVAPALAPEPLSPLKPQNDTVAALSPVTGGSAPALTALAPVASARPERLTATTPAAPSVGAAAPAAVQAITAATVQAAPRVTRPPLATPPPRPVAAAPAPPAPGSPAAIVGELVARIRARVGDPCLVAMPQQAANGAPELVMLSSSETAIGEFATAVLADVDPQPGQRAVLVDERQCVALTYIRENPAYPAFRLTAGLATDQLSGQAMLQGAIGRAGGNYISLLVVDDNGVVQVANQYLTFAGGEARFDIPLRRAGNPRDTSPMLIAIASDTRPATLDTQNGQLAVDFFAALRAELGSRAPLVMIPFDLR